MVQSRSLWLLSLAATAASATNEFFYGKNGLSKLHINQLFADKNCGCTGSWNETEFANISQHFAAELDQLIPKEITTARGHKDASPLSIGSNTYTLALDYSSNYSRPNSSDAAVWGRLISELLLVGNRSPDQSILIGEYINDLGGSHNFTLTVYGDKSCVNVFEPCVRFEPEHVNHQHTARDAAAAGPALDWSDKEAVKEQLQLDVYNTSSLDDAVRTGKKLPQYIYHEDIHMIVDTETIKPLPHNETDSKLEERQACSGWFSYDSYWREGAWATWSDWLPVSSCHWTGLDPAGGSATFNSGFSMAYAESLDFGWKGVSSAFSASFTFTITQTYSQSLAYTCNIPGNSVGQIWAQNRVGSGYVYKTTCSGYCTTTSCGNRQGPSYSSAPAVGINSLGCSTGSQNVACGRENPNWFAYSVWTHTPPH